MKVGCVILNYNDHATTRELVNNICNYESIDHIVIVDNKSTDDSFEKLKELEKNNISVIMTDKNGGYGYGNNYGIKYLVNNHQVGYILISNPDVLFTDNCVIELKKELQKNKKAAIAVPISLYPSGKMYDAIAWRIPSVIQEIISASVFLSRIVSNKLTYDNILVNNLDVVEVEVVPGSLLMVKSQEMVNYGMYDEEFFLYCEEQVLAEKMKNHNLCSLLVLNETYIHNHSVSIDKTYNSLFKKKKIMLRSKLLYLKKYKKISKTQYFIVSIYFKLSLLESLLIPILKKIRGVN